MGVKVKLKIDTRRGVLKELERRTKNTFPVMRKVPDIMRFGSGSLDQQIRTRTHIAPNGAMIRWKEPDYVRGGISSKTVELERVMFDAVRGRSTGGFTKVGRREVEIGVDDAVIRARSASLGNKIVSNTSYFGFVTGEFQRRTTPAKPVPTKPVANRGGSGHMRWAMFWFIFLNYGVWLSETEFGSIRIPPKNMGTNPIMLKRISDAVGRYLTTGNVQVA
jgi:hypothetical protein